MTQKDMINFTKRENVIFVNIAEPALTTKSMNKRRKTS